jgi:tetratricopeptide (TPR) repeat protein
MADGRAHGACPSGGTRVAGAGALAVLVVLTFSPVLDNGFVSLDDKVYILGNPPVAAGLGAAGVRWAFTSFYDGVWQPLTWLSHMLDVSLFGLQPRGHHAVGLALHVLNTVLLLGVLQGMTGSFLAPLLATFLFAMHPLRVEPVAWAAGRKDLLCGFFWLLALAAYLRHARKPGPWRLAQVAIAHVAALLAKPMAVTLPFALLVLDWWPLGRLRPGAQHRTAIRSRNLVFEKIPLFAASVLSSLAALWAHRAGGGGDPLSPLPPGVRLANAAVSSARYLGKVFLPARLSSLYPHPGGYWPAAEIAAAVALLVALSLAAVAVRRRAPALAAGWLWFLGTLVPAIGLVQVGYQSMADRYTYLPSLGIALALLWGVPQLAPPAVSSRVLGAAALLACLTLPPLSWLQARTWRDDRSLFGHALAIDADNWHARVNYGATLAAEGRFSEAVPHYRAALHLQPSNATALNDLGVALYKLGRPEEAVEYLRTAVTIAPAYAEAHYNLGVALAEGGRREEARTHFLSVLQRVPDHRDALYNLGVIAAAGGRPREAEEYFRRANAVGAAR